MNTFIQLLKNAYAVRIDQTLFTEWTFAEHTNQPENEIIRFSGRDENNHLLGRIGKTEKIGR